MSSKTGSTRSNTRRARCARSSPVRKAAFFFYGTLLDLDMLSTVLEQRVWPHSLVPAVLRGHRRKGVRGANYPVVMRQRRASVDGVILDGVGASSRFAFPPMRATDTNWCK